MEYRHLLIRSLLLAMCTFACGCQSEEDTQFTSGGQETGNQLNGGSTGIGSDQMNTESTSGGEGITLPSEPIEGCIGPESIEDLEETRSATSEECVTCEGATAPSFALRDLSPTSCGVGKYYGLDTFVGRVTFVVLLRSTCGYCHGQLEKLEQMRFELLALGHEIHMLVINQMDTAETIDLLTQRSQIPMLQDVEEVNAWEALSDPKPEGEGRIGGDKDDMYIYNAEGELWRFLDDDDPEHSLDLSTDEGYMYLKNILIEALSE